MIEIHVNGSKTIYCNQGELLFDVLVRNGMHFIGNCGGMGRCNACTVYDEIHSVYIRSCKHEITEDMNISLFEKKPDVLNTYISDMAGKTGTNVAGTTCGGGNDSIQAAEGHGNKRIFAADGIKNYGIAIDVGTTTIAMELIDINRNQVWGSYQTYNSQISHGADVISRIAYGTSEWGFQELRKLVLNDLYKGIMTLTEQGKTSIERIVIAGNTTMLSIIEGYTLENLAGYPFTIKNRNQEELNGAGLFKQVADEVSCLADTSIVCLPNVSAFVGADVAAGAFVAGVGNDSSYKMLIDLGTNGEIILANKEKGYATSCACGPAFEGCFRSGSMHGTSLFDMLAILRKRRVIDKQGILAGPYFQNGYHAGHDMVIDMELIQGFLLAKAAIGAGITTLLNECGIESEDIDKIYISGGFGFHLNIANAIYLGMFPESFRDKAVASGNTSLLGARSCLVAEDKVKELNRFIDMITPVNMGENQEFDRKYIENMYFPN